MAKTEAGHRPGETLLGGMGRRTAKSSAYETIRDTAIQIEGLQ